MMLLPCLASSAMPVNMALNDAHVPFRTARDLADVFQKYTPTATSAAMAAAIQPMMGMFIMATLTARQAVTAAILNAPKAVEAMPAKVVDADLIMYHIRRMMRISSII